MIEIAAIIAAFAIGACGVIWWLGTADMIDTIAARQQKPEPPPCGGHVDDLEWFFLAAHAQRQASIQEEEER